MKSLIAIFAICMLFSFGWSISELVMDGPYNFDALWSLGITTFGTVVFFLKECEHERKKQEKYGEEWFRKHKTWK